MYTTPLFSVGDLVYFKESAQLGFLESANISFVANSDGIDWVYAITFGKKLPSPISFGDANTYQQTRLLYFNESELLTYCEAIVLVETNLTQRLADIQQKRQANC